MQELADSLAINAERAARVVGQLLESREQDRVERQGRQREILVTATQADVHAPAPSNRHGLLEQPRLADSRFPLHEHHAWMACCRVLEPPLQQGEFLLAPDEWRTALVGARRAVTAQG